MNIIPSTNGYTLHNVCVFTSLDSLFGWCHLQNTYSMCPPFQHGQEVSRSNFPIMSWFLHPAYLLHQQIPQLMGVLCANNYIYMQVQFIVPCANSLVSFPFMCVSHSIVSYNVLSPANCQNGWFQKLTTSFVTLGRSFVIQWRYSLAICYMAAANGYL